MPVGVFSKVIKTFLVINLLLHGNYYTKIIICQVVILYLLTGKLLESKIYYMENTDFVEWLQLELNKRNWRKADLAKASGLSSAQITRIMKREQGPGPEACTAIARAFKMSPERVFRLAGLLPWEPEKPEDPPTFWEWVMYYVRSSDEERDQMLEMAEELSKKKDEDEKE